MIWVSNMKTTIDIADPLLRRARQLARRRRSTLEAVVEQALRDTFDREREAPRPRKVRTRTFAGNGLHPGLSWDSWSEIRSTA